MLATEDSKIISVIQHLGMVIMLLKDKLLFYWRGGALGFLFVFIFKHPNLWPLFIFFI